MGEGGAEAVTAVTGSVSDVISMLLGLGEALEASAGFNCSNLTFRLKLPEVKEQTKQASAADDKVAKKEPRTAVQEQEPKEGQTTRQPILLSNGPPILTIGRFKHERNKDPKKDKKVPIDPWGKTEIGLRVVKDSNLMLCTVCLYRLHGWDTKAGDQISIEITNPSDEIGPRTILSIFGFVNPMGPGFARFYGSLSVKATHQGVTTAPIGEMSIVAGASWDFEAKSETNGFFLNVAGFLG